MPTYTYKCAECDLVFEVFHSMSETAEQCEGCKTTGKLSRVVPTRTTVTKAPLRQADKPGHLVNKYIEDVKQEVKEEKLRLKTQEYEK